MRKGKKRRNLFIVVPLCLVLACTIVLAVLYAAMGEGGMIAMFAAIDRTDMMQAKEYRAEDGNMRAYRLYVPETYDDAKAIPLVLFLHGAGERGNDNRAQTKKNSVMQTLLDEENLAKYPCIVLAPQCPEDDWWDTKELRVLLLMTQVTYNIDAARIYVTGISMGGFATWNLLAEYPDYFAAAVPVCGGGDADTATLFKDVPIWAFHGAKDTTVRPEGSRDMVKALEDAGAKEVKYTEYPEEKHQSWEKAYREAELFPWMFAQARELGN